MLLAEKARSKLDGKRRSSTSRFFIAGVGFSTSDREQGLDNKLVSSMETKQIVEFRNDARRLILGDRIEAMQIQRGDILHSSIHSSVAVLMRTAIVYR